MRYQCGAQEALTDSACAYHRLKGEVVLDSEVVL